MGTAADGSQLVLMINLLFNFFYDNQVVTDINNNLDQTSTFNLELWPNTFLFSLNSSGGMGDCCVLGFHTYFYEPGGRATAYLGDRVRQLDLAGPLWRRIPGRDGPFP